MASSLARGLLTVFGGALERGGAAFSDVKKEEGKAKRLRARDNLLFDQQLQIAKVKGNLDFKTAQFTGDITLEAARIRAGGAETVAGIHGETALGVAGAQGETRLEVVDTQGDTARDVAIIQGDTSRVVVGTQGDTARAVAGIAAASRYSVAELNSATSLTVSELLAESRKDVAGIQGKTSRDVAGTQGDTARDVAVIGAESREGISDKDRLAAMKRLDLQLLSTEWIEQGKLKLKTKIALAKLLEPVGVPFPGNRAGELFIMLAGQIEPHALIDSETGEPLTDGAVKQSVFEKKIDAAMAANEGMTRQQATNLELKIVELKVDPETGVQTLVNKFDQTVDTIDPFGGKTLEEVSGIISLEPLRFSLWALANDAAGPYNAIQRVGATALSALIPGFPDLAIEEIQAAQIYTTAKQELIRSMVLSPRFNAIEIERIREEINLGPKFFDSAKILKNRLIGLAIALQQRMQFQAMDFRNLSLSRGDRQSSARNAIAIRNFLLVMDVPQEHFAQASSRALGNTNQGLSVNPSDEEFDALNIDDAYFDEDGNRRIKKRERNQ